MGGGVCEMELCECDGGTERGVSENSLADGEVPFLGGLDGGSGVVACDPVAGGSGTLLRGSVSMRC